MTLEGGDISDDAHNLMWVSEGADSDVLVVENRSYPGLTHRRSVWFVNRRFFVLLDEAIGGAPGQLDLPLPVCARRRHVRRRGKQGVHAI